MRKTTLAAVAAVLVGCNAIDVGRIDAARYPVSMVCIEENPKVKVEDFVAALRAGFDRHGIDSHVYQGALPAACEYRLTYTARRSWDFAPYLAYAEIRLMRGGELVGRVDYNHNNSLSLMKWEGSEAKIGPLLDDMLAQFKAGAASPGAPRPVAPVASPSPAPAQAVGEVGRYLYQAEKLVWEQRCSGLALAARGPGIELYTASCAGVPTSIKCEWGQCATQ